MPSPSAELVIAFSILLILLMPCGIAGLALINTGLGRARSGSHSMVACLCAVAVASIIFFCLGFGLEKDLPFLSVSLAGRNWDLIGSGGFFLRGIDLSDSHSQVMALFQTFSVCLAAIIPLGAGADRWRLSAICVSTALLAGLVFPVYAHWALGMGWLAQLGAHYGLGRGYMDGGSGTVQTVGGLTALAIAWIIGPRRGKYGNGGRSVAIPGHDAVMVLSGCLLAWVGWLGLNGAGALLLSAAPPIAIAIAGINTTLAAGCAGMASAALTKFRFGRPDASLIANGWLCGLVASSASCVFVAPAEAAATGLVAGILLVFCVELVETRLRVDDPAGAISVHAAGGIWGLLAAGLFARAPEGSGQWLSQVIGIAVLIGFVLPLTYLVNALLNRFHRQRVPAAAEVQGLDLHELGAGAYPEFVIHGEDFTARLH